MKKNILYLGHLYHEKTKSTEFIRELLDKHFNVDYVSYNPYSDDYKSDERNHTKLYDYLICFQIMPTRKNLDGSYRFRKGLFFPMYDATIELADEMWDEYKDFLIICFSKTLYNKLLGFHMECRYIQYFPEPFKAYNWGNEHSVFFWQRRECISLQTVSDKLKNTDIQEVRLHVAMDPEQNFIEYDNDLKNKIIKSEWFDTKNMMLEEMEKASLYIAPRRYEGIGMSFLEAMAMGRCVIAPNEGTMNEYIRDGYNGYLYDINVVEPLKIKNIRLIQQNAYQTIVDGHRKWTEEKEKIVKWIENMNTMPKVTVVTSLKFEAGLKERIKLKQCIESVHRQNYGNIEHVILASDISDTISDVLKRYEGLGWIRLLRAGPGNQFMQYKEVLSLIEGFYVIFLEFDSYFTQANAVEEYVLKIQEKNYDFVFSDCRIVNRDDIFIGIQLPMPERFFSESPFVYQAAIYKKCVLKDLDGYMGNYNNAGDFELINTLFLRGYPFSSLTVPYVTVRRESPEGDIGRKDELINIYSKAYGLERDQFYSILYKMAFDGCCTKELYLHIRNCIKGELRARMPLALLKKWENDEEYNICPEQVSERIEENEEFPLVTVVTVTYNVLSAGRKDTFIQCMESIHNQEYPNIEYLIIDGASNDGTLELVKEYADKGWLRYISEPDEDVWDAMRKGLQEAKGKYINYLNTDDLFTGKTSVGAAVTALEKEEADFFYSLANRIEKNGDVSSAEMVDISYYGNEDTVWWGKGLCHQSMFVKTDVIKELDTFSTTIKISLDNYQMLQLVAKDKKGVYLNEPLVTFRMGGISAVENVQDVFATYFYDCVGKSFGMTFEECRSLWLLKCIDEESISYNIRILQKLQRNSWREYFAQRLLKTINGDNSKEQDYITMLLAKTQTEAKLYKFKNYFELLNIWLSKKAAGKRISEYLLSKGMKDIAVYGVGELGSRFYEDLAESSITMKYAIDNNDRRSFYGIPVFKTSAYQSWERVDAIIVTPTFDFDNIYHQLKEKNSCPIISLADVINNF